MYHKEYPHNNSHSYFRNCPHLAGKIHSIFALFLFLFLMNGATAYSETIEKWGVYAQPDPQCNCAIADNEAYDDKADICGFGRLASTFRTEKVQSFRPPPIAPLAGTIVIGGQTDKFPIAGPVALYEGVDSNGNCIGFSGYITLYRISTTICYPSMAAQNSGCCHDTDGDGLDDSSGRSCAPPPPGPDNNTGSPGTDTGPGGNTGPDKDRGTHDSGCGSGGTGGSL